jgi:hypothetical protein
MIPAKVLTTARILEVFNEEIAARGGRVADTFHDGWRLFARSVLARTEEVKPGDRLRGGVALKATKDGVWLYPYVFRQVCRNGAILSETLSSRSLGDLHEQEADAALETVREAIAACCEPHVFPDAVRRMRTAAEVHADLALNLLPLLSRLSSSVSARVLSPMLERFFRDGDHSQFGLGNAITAVARDTEDPDVRWNLEELGGGLLIGAASKQPADKGGAAARPERFAVAVG